MTVDFKQPPDATCRGCLALIRWVELNGKLHPINPDPTPKGTLGIIAPEVKVFPYAAARLVALSQVRRAEWTGNLYVSHFATCEKAGDFRRRRPKLR